MVGYFYVNKCVNNCVKEYYREVYVHDTGGLDWLTPSASFIEEFVMIFKPAMIQQVFFSSDQKKQLRKKSNYNWQVGFLQVPKI